MTLLVRGDNWRRSRMTLTGISFYGLGAIIAVATPHIQVGLFGFALMGAAHSLGGVASTSTLQTQVSEDFRGRVLALFIMSSFVGIPLGSVVGGRLGDRFGLRPTLAAYGVALGLYGVYAVVRLDWLRIFDTSESSGGSPPRGVPAERSTAELGRAAERLPVEGERRILVEGGDAQ
jgi:MFS family permease